MGTTELSKKVKEFRDYVLPSARLQFVLILRAPYVVRSEQNDCEADI